MVRTLSRLWMASSSSMPSSLCGLEVVELEFGTHPNNFQQILCLLPWSDSSVAVPKLHLVHRTSNMSFEFNSRTMGWRLLPKICSWDLSSTLCSLVFMPGLAMGLKGEKVNCLCHPVPPFPILRPKLPILHPKTSSCSFLGKKELDSPFWTTEWSPLVASKVKQEALSYHAKVVRREHLQTSPSYGCECCRSGITNGWIGYQNHLKDDYKLQVDDLIRHILLQKPRLDSISIPN